MNFCWVLSKSVVDGVWRLEYWSFYTIWNYQHQKHGYQLRYRESWQITQVLVEKKALCETANSKYAYMIKMRWSDKETQEFCTGFSILWTVLISTQHDLLYIPERFDTNNLVWVGDFKPCSITSVSCKPIKGEVPRKLAVDTGVQKEVSSCARFCEGPTLQQTEQKDESAWEEV